MITLNKKRIGKKGYNNAYIFFGVILFYASFLVIMGFIGSDFIDSAQPEVESLVDEEASKPVLVGKWIWDLAVKSGFIGGIIIGVAILPLWLNALIFTPLLAIMIYLIIDLLWIG